MYDYHIHSNRSADGQSSVAEVTSAAKELGLSGICFTEHWEAQGADTAWRPDFSVFEPSTPYVKLGIELGTPHETPDDAREVIASAEFDFVLGSVHALPGKSDFYFNEQWHRQDSSSSEMLREYILTHFDMLKFGDFDSVAHLGYPLRYISNPKLSLTDYREELTELLTALAKAGKAIECNTSGFSYANGPLPTLETLKLWRACGGELVTLGSDAHSAEKCGQNLKLGSELLLEAGFTRYCIFERRKPRFIKL